MRFGIRFFLKLQNNIKLESALQIVQKISNLVTELVSYTITQLFIFWGVWRTTKIVDI